MRFLSESVNIKLSPVTPMTNMMTKPRKNKMMMIPKQRMVQILGRVILPVITASFIFAYVIAAIYLHENPGIKYI